MHSNAPDFIAEQALIATSQLQRSIAAYDFYALESHDWLSDMAESHNVEIEESH